MINLFCIPYAGGSAAIYNRWKPYLNDDIRLTPVELAGRGKRFKEPFCDSLEEMADDVCKIIKVGMDSPYALFGHSMGGALVYELACRIKREQGKEPIHIFISGRRPPHIINSGKLLHELPFDDFKEEILKLGGTPKELFENKELMNIFLPILRADYRIIENYKYKQDKIVMSCGLTVLAGEKDDESDPKYMIEWKKYTKSQFSFYIFNGGHFFLHDNIDKITDIINHELTIPYV